MNKPRRKPKESLSIRLNPITYERLVAAAEASQRSLGQEVERRLERTFEMDPTPEDYRPNQGTSVSQLKAAADRLDISLVFETRVVSDAHNTGSATAIKKLRGWWSGTRYLGATAAAAFSALPEEAGAPWPCSDHLRRNGGC